MFRQEEVGASALGGTASGYQPAGVTGVGEAKSPWGIEIRHNENLEGKRSTRPLQIRVEAALVKSRAQEDGDYDSNEQEGDLVVQKQSARWVHADGLRGAGGAERPLNQGLP